MKNKIFCSLTVLYIMLLSEAALASSIDPYDTGAKFAYGENVGWFNFKPSQSGISFINGKVNGYVWQENIGWINLSPQNYGGVTYDDQLRLSGYAWGENVGWIKFDHSFGQVTSDFDGNFSGWAWGENIGWIHFSSASPVTYKVQAGVVNHYDLANFTGDWLMSGNEPGNLDGSRTVDFVDYGILASYWFSFCPADWPLK